MPERLNEKHTWLDTALSAVSALVCAAMCAAAAAYVLLDSPAHGALICAAAAALSAACVLTARFAGRLGTAALAAASFVLALGVRAAYVLAVDTVPVSDFELLYSAAQGVASGDASALSDEYFQLWGYQIPFVLYESAAAALGGGVRALGLMNALWGALTALLVYALAAKFAGPASAFAASALYALSPEAVMLTPVLTNQCVSLAFILLGVYLASGGTWRRAALAGCALSLGNLMRPEGVLALAGIAAAAVLALIRREKPSQILIRLAALLAGYFALGEAASWAIALSGIAPQGIGNAAPEWKFVLGLDTDSLGMYSSANEWILDLKDAAKRRSAALDAIRASLENAGGAGGLLSFFAQKTARFWGMYADSWLGDANASDTFMRIAGRAAFIASGALAAAGCLRRRGGEAFQSVCAAVTVNFAAYLFIEVQPRYRYFVLPFVCALAAPGIELIASLFTGHRRGERV